jgi:nucleotide-binding universal stress UspA family protein
MFKHLLIPLDGSRLAESVIPAADYLAKHLKASVTLIHIIEKNPPDQIHGEQHIQNTDEAEHYLQHIAVSQFSPGIQVDTHTHTSEVEDVARSIAEHGGEYEIDLIVMCTHGSGGMRDFLFGNIAQQVISLGKRPTLVIHPTPENMSMSWQFRRFLIPLDGQSAHERGIGVAGELARSFGSSVRLLLVVPTYGKISGSWVTTSRLLPGTTSTILDMSVEDARDYLHRKSLELTPDGIDVMTEIARGDPSEEITRIAQESQSDLLVLTTHGKSGTKAFWAGSIASKICKNCQLPLLFIPTEE